MTSDTKYNWPFLLGISLVSAMGGLLFGYDRVVIGGAFVSINQLTIVTGILAAQFINWRIARPVPPEATVNDILNSWNGQIGWRWMFYACAFTAALFFILMWFVPESP